MWALFGQDTMYSTLKEDLRFLNLLYNTLKDIDLKRDHIDHSMEAYD